MQIVIDIPEEKYNMIKNKMYCGIYDAEVYNAIANGKPLPKSHGRLIDEQDAIDTLSVMFSGNYEILNDALECIEQLPEVIEADGGDVE